MNHCLALVVFFYLWRHARATDRFSLAVTCCWNHPALLSLSLSWLWLGIAEIEIARVYADTACDMIVLESAPASEPAAVHMTTLIACNMVDGPSPSLSRSRLLPAPLSRC